MGKPKKFSRGAVSKGINQGEHDAQRESGSAAAAKRRGQRDRGSGAEGLSSSSSAAPGTKRQAALGYLHLGLRRHAAA